MLAARLACRPSAQARAVLARSLSTAAAATEDDANTLRFNPKNSKHTSTLIFLHGLGDHPRSLWTLSNISPPGTRVSCPGAPMRKITINNDEESRAWNDLYSRSRMRDCVEDEEGIFESVARIHALIEEEAQQVPHNRIAIGGMGQGASIAIWAAIHCPHRLAGVVCWQGYCPIVNHRPDADAVLNIPVANRDLPIKSFHGSKDQRLPVSYCVESFEKLRPYGLVVEVDIEDGAKDVISKYQLHSTSKFIAKLLSGEK
eukprot:gnl/Spiro4/23122_TR11437_c0_g1_i1.p1 gnl/Spiro4/23122_TR11437_c0_g1~~gnl/Spiro4/23122_TR11437_c0_g1_i1.p1  ORF type:complete len:283 (+),score=45.52 gnl/Spiro4/23122_TR11437_c0_g1_i1:78-851(+)